MHIYKNQYYHAGNIILEMEVHMEDVCIPLPTARKIIKHLSYLIIE